MSHKHYTVDVIGTLTVGTRARLLIASGLASAAIALTHVAEKLTRRVFVKVRVR